MKETKNQKKNKVNVYVWSNADGDYSIYNSYAEVLSDEKALDWLEEHARGDADLISVGTLVPVDREHLTNNDIMGEDHPIIVDWNDQIDKLLYFEEEEQDFDTILAQSTRVWMQDEAEYFRGMDEFEKFLKFLEDQRKAEIMEDNNDH